MTRGLIVGYSQISEDAQKLFQAERVVIGKCPRCAAKPSTRARRTTTAETGPASLSCGRMTDFLRNGQGVHAENRRRIAQRRNGKGKGPALHKTGKPTTGRCFWPILEGNTSTIALNGGTKTKNSKHRSVATHPEKSLSRPFCRVGDFLFGEAPIPCMTDALVGLISFRFTFQNRIALLYYA